MPFVDRPAPADEAGLSARVERAVAGFARPGRRARAARRRGPGRAARSGARAVRVPRRAAGRAAPSRPRAGWRTWPSWSACAHDFEAVDAFLEQVALVSDTDDLDPEESYLTLMTLHSAKGLEYPVVFLMGMEEGVFPHIRSIGEPDQLEEERRLAYVGHHPGAEAPPRHPRLDPRAVRRHPVQPAEPLPRRDPERAVRRGGDVPPFRSGVGLRAQSRATPAARHRPRRGCCRSAPAAEALAGRTHLVDAALRAAASAAAEGATGAAALGLRVGDDVQHARWGDGVVLAISGGGGQGRGPRPLPGGGGEAPAAGVGAVAAGLIGSLSGRWPAGAGGPVAFRRRNPAGRVESWASAPSQCERGQRGRCHTRSTPWPRT